MKISINNVFRKSGNVLLNILAWLLAIFINFPLIWMFLSSVKVSTDVYRWPPVIIPKSFTFTHYILLFKQTNIARYLLNSVIIAVSTTLIAILIATLCAYSLTRFKFSGSKIISRAYIFIYLIPKVVMLIPIYIIMNRLKLYDTLFSLILANLITAFPYSYLLLRSYIGGISKSMEEAAMIDGATRMGAFVKIILPVAAPGIAATSIFSAIVCWNEFLFALVLISSDINRTLTIGISGLLDPTGIPSWGMLMAAGVIVTIPLLIFFIFIQKRMVVGLSAGALKE